MAYTGPEWKTSNEGITINPSWDCNIEWVRDFDPDLSEWVKIPTVKPFLKGDWESIVQSNPDFYQGKPENWYLLLEDELSS